MAASGGPPLVSGAQAFLLYDSFGFPLEITQEIAAERGAGVDVLGFQVAMDEQRQRSKDAAKVCATCLRYRDLGSGRAWMFGVLAASCFI